MAHQTPQPGIANCVTKLIAMATSLSTYGPPSNTWFPGPTEVLNPNGTSIGAAVFAGLTSVTDRQTDRPTDHATRLVTIGRIYVRSLILTLVSITAPPQGCSVCPTRAVLTGSVDCIAPVNTSRE